MKIILISIFLANIIWQFLSLIWDCLHWTRGEKMIIDGYQREDMFKDLLKDLNKDLNSIQIPTPVDINESSTKQIVYKIDGDLNGNIKGDNVTVILMGDGNLNGNIKSKDGNVVLIKGNINGDVKANKIICSTEPTTNNNTIKRNPAKDVESPKLPVKTLRSCDIPSNNNKCSKCAFAKKMPYLSLSGINTDNEYNCLKFNKIVDGDYCCRDFIDLKTVENLNNKINDIINRK